MMRNDWDFCLEFQALNQSDFAEQFVLENITVKDLERRLSKGDRVLLLDVRGEDERKICSLGENWLQLSELEERSIELDPSQEIIVYCHTGGRSVYAAMLLRSIGFANVKNLEGGIDAWAREIDPTMKRY